MNDRKSLCVILQKKKKKIFLHTGNLCPILLWSDFNSKFLDLHNNLWNQNKFGVENHHCGVEDVCVLKNILTVHDHIMQQIEKESC